MMSEDIVSLESSTATSQRTTSTVLTPSKRQLEYSATRDPELVWFMSFSASSADFFLHLIHESTGYSTGTNYGVVLMNPKGKVYPSKGKSWPIFSGGPSYYTKSLKRSKDTVVIRTNGSGYCL